MTSISGTNTSATPFDSDAIQRVLFIASAVHIYNIPPLTTSKGYHAASWTADSNKREIFTARLRIVETAIPHSDGGETLCTEILLEDPVSGELFAAAPYTDVGVVEAALDSSRFFAVRVVGDEGRKAVLGAGFEERSEAIDFRIALQDVRKVQGVEERGGSVAREVWAQRGNAVQKKDFSLKAGEMIHVDIGRRPRKKIMDEEPNKALLSIPPPPYVQREGSGGMMPFLPPPPSALDIKAERRRSRPELPPEAGSVADLGFDDGEFGEFQ
jgi:adaptin ear-binding coat-associated protein 1/2